MADEPSELEKVYTFLKSRKVEEDVCKKFQEEVMDFMAIGNASDKDFQGLGLLRKGDILALRAFVSNSVDGEKNEERSEKKRKLLELSKQLCKKSTKTKTQRQGTLTARDSKCDSKKVQVGWQHYNEVEKRYVAMRLAKGGGTRELSVPLNATAEDMIDLLTDVFFPEGFSMHGSTDEMQFKLGNFKCEEVTGDDFTLSSYIAKHKLSKVKMYLLSRPRKVEKRKKCHYVSDDDDEADLLAPAFEDQSTATSSTPSGGLLGSSEERASLKDHQLMEYLDSLEKDQAKECAKQEESKKEEAKQEELLHLRRSRALRVPSEPSVSEPHIVVSVRHVTIGVQTRRFPKSVEVTCSAIYDWVGSLSLIPEYFILSSCDDPIISPSLPIESIDRMMLTMAETAKGPAYPDEDVVFHGFGEPPGESLLDATAPDDRAWLLTSISETPPPFLMEEDEVKDTPSGSSEDTSVSVNNSSIDSPGRRFREMVNVRYSTVTEKEGEAFTQRRMDALDNLTRGGVTNVWVHRETVMTDILKMYETSREITQGLATFSFYEEEGMDLDGVKREAYSLFWKQALQEYFEGSSTFVPRVGPGIDESTMRTLGRIISHQYVLTGIFPVHINRAFMVAALCGRHALDNEDLIDAFLEYLPESESQELKVILTQSEHGQLSDVSCDFLLDFLCEYQVTKRPSATNLKATLLQVAKNELISKPAMAMESIREGLLDGDYKDLWKCSKEDVSKLYDVMQLTSQHVVSMLSEEPSTHLHKPRLQVFSYLKKYIRCLSRKELGRFVRYVTGSPVPVVESIKVVFHVNELGSLPHPLAHTCAATIDLPDSGYASFNDFRVQMDSVLDNELSWKFTSL